MKATACGILVFSLLAVPVFGTSPMARVLQKDLEIQERLQVEELAQLQRVEANFADALTRVQRGNADYLHALVEEELIESLRRRDEDVRLAEGQLLMDMLEFQQLRQSTLARESLMRAMRAEIQELTGTTDQQRDLISGVWDVVLDPGGQRGRMELMLDGTLIQGTYQLDGGWSGSLRGTLVGGRVRLERIDAEMGFVAILYGAVRSAGADVRLEGKWESTQLAAGMPSAGGWVAERADEAPQ